MTAHFDDASLRAFASGALDPAALLAADDHLAGCAECRARAAALLNAPVAAAAMAPSSVDDGHLSDDEVQRAAVGAAATAAMQDHLARCERCRHEVASLREWATRPQATAPADAGRRTWLLLAASLVAAVSLGWWLVSAPAVPRLAGLDVLTGEERTRVEAILANDRVELPVILDELGGNGEVLMGTPRRESFAPLSPLGTVVATDRPAFTWTRLNGARSYRVVIVDAALTPVAESPALDGSDWTPSGPLQRGRTYTWQVMAAIDGGTRTAPAPPAPPARFHVLEAGTAARLGAIEAGEPDAHLLLGLLYAEAGLLDGAASRLRRVPRGAPHADLARTTLDAIEARRGRP